MTDFFSKMVEIINSIIEYIKELVSTIRKINDGEDVEGNA